MGIGLYLFVAPDVVRTVSEIGTTWGYEIHHLGRVEAGERKVIFEPEGGAELLPLGS